MHKWIEDCSGLGTEIEYVMGEGRNFPVDEFLASGTLEKGSEKND
jgi:hypothetical protein